MALTIAALCVIAAVAVGAARSRTVFRVAVRDFLRRPAQSALVVGGLLIASLVLAASLVAGDAQEAMFQDIAYRAWGPVDLVVGSLSGGTFPEKTARAALDDERVKVLSDGRAPRFELPASVEDETRATRETLINLIGIDPSSEETLGEFVLSGAGETDPAPGAAVINERLARRLGAEVGDALRFTTVSIDAKRVSLSLRVAGIVRNEGKADRQLRPNAFVMLSELQLATKGMGLVNQLVLSAGGPDRAPRQVRALQDAVIPRLNALSGFPTDTKNPKGFRVAGAKGESLKNAEEQSSFFRTVLGSLGALVAVTSIALIVNLFVMLGEERRSELGTMRALGLKRGGLVLLGMTEGVLYSITAAAVGALVGALLGGYLAGAMVDVFASFVRDASIEFTKAEFDFRAGTILVAASGGFLISVVSVAAVSYRTSRLSVVAAIRGLPESGSRRRRAGWRTVLAAVGGLGALGGQLAGVPLLVLFSGTGFLIGLSALSRRFVKPRSAATLGAGATVAFGLYAYIFLPDFDRDFETGFILVTTAAIIITIASVILMAANLTILERLAGFFGPRIRAVIRTATAYPVGYRFRTAMSMAMFALVLYMVAAFAVWGGLGGGDFQEQSGGFQVLARASFPVEDLSAGGASATVGLLSTGYSGGYKVGDSQEVTFPVTLFGVDARLAATNEFEFTEKVEGQTPRQVWDQLAAQKDVAIIDFGTNPGGAKVGDSLEIRTDKGPRHFKVIGLLNESYLTGLFISREAFAELYPNRAIDSAWLVKSKPGVKATELAKQIEATHPGVDAASIREIFETNVEGQRTFVGIFQVLLKLGVVIGISGLAIASIRTVLERRQAVGILRALGFRRSMVGASLLLETLLIATLGCAIGVATGLVGTYFLIDEQVPNLRFSADWPQIGNTLLIVYAATLAFTGLPAWRAASLNPAEAVRYVE